MNKWSGTFELVNPRAIVIDHRYQRDEVPGLIDKIAKAPNWEKFGVLVCARRENKMLYCFDGQQRLAGLMASEKPPLEVPVVWFAVKTPQEEANLFVAVNVDRKGVTAYAKWEGKLFAGDPIVRLITDTVESIGFTLGNQLDGKTISAFGKIERIYNRSGQEGLQFTLMAVREAWPDDPAAIRGDVLDALNIVLAGSNGSISRSAARNALARTTAAQIRQRSKQLKYDLGGSAEQNLVRAIRELTKLK
jgi:hypothetical protein